MGSNTIVEKKLESIASELKNLKSIVINLSPQTEHKKVVKLKGLLKGINVSEDDIEEAKISLFKVGA